jgi:hypothetical protein
MPIKLPLFGKPMSQIKPKKLPIENYIKMILTKVSENELLSPIIVLEILKKKQNMKYETVKNFVINSLQKEKKNLDKDKKEFESNFGRLEQINHIRMLLKKKCLIRNITYQRGM